MSAVPTIASEPQLDAKIAATSEMHGPHVAMKMALAKLLAEQIQRDAAPPANNRKVELTAWATAYTTIFICMSCFLGCILAVLFALRSITITLVGFAFLAGFDYITVGLPDFFTINHSYRVHWGTAAIGAGLLGCICGPVVTLCIGGIAFVKRARGKLDEASKGEHTKMKSIFNAVVKSGCSFLFDTALGALMYPVGSFAIEWYLGTAREENLFMATPGRCIAIGVLGIEVPIIISSLWKLVKGKKGGEIQSPADDPTEDLEKQPLLFV